MNEIRLFCHLLTRPLMSERKNEVASYHVWQSWTKCCRLSKSALKTHFFHVVLIGLGGQVQKLNPLNIERKEFCIKSSCIFWSEIEGSMSFALRFFQEDIYNLIIFEKVWSKNDLLFRVLWSTHHTSLMRFT